MDKSLEDNLYQAILVEDHEAVSCLISQGANPNKTASPGKTCLGEAANIGNISILKLLIDASKNDSATKPNGSNRKRNTKSHKRKLRHDGQSDGTVVKCKNLSDRTFKDYYVGQCSVTAGQKNVASEKNQGYFVFIHSEGSSSDESKISSLKSPLSPSTLTPSPNADLEWDEEIGNVAPTTSEDETWSSMYKWYAAILECTGAAIAAASVVSSGIDQQDAFMRTALHYASDQGHEGAVQLLLDAGCKVDITAGDGLTPLHVAVIRNHTEIVRMLINAGSHVNYKTHEKMTPLHFAASRGYLELVKMLVSNGAYLEARDTNERTALYLAAGRGHTEVVQYLITSGANVNGEEIHGYTPLCEAVWQRYAEVVEIMLASGARITHSHKLLHNAIIQRQHHQRESLCGCLKEFYVTDRVAVLCNSNRDKQTLEPCNHEEADTRIMALVGIAAAAQGHTKIMEGIVKMLANVGGGINLHNDNGDTPLLLAARLSQPTVARVLLEKGANVNACNSITGASALHIAVESIDCPKDFEELLICLLEYRIDTNAIALTGDTALNRALLLHKDHAAVSLIRHGADVNACDLHSCGLDNLSIASRRHAPDLAAMLIKAGHCTTIPDPSAPPPKPGTTTHWLYHVSKNPLDLADLCRIKIRNYCKNRTMYSYIPLLPLPKSLKRFLMMEDEGIY